MKNNTILIAVRTADGYKATEAAPVHVAGLDLAIHPTLNKPDLWSITDPGTGLALQARSKTKGAAITDLARKIENNGVDKVRTMLSTYPLAPAPETLPRFEQPAPPVEEKADTARVAELIGKVADLAPEEVVAVSRALSSRSGRLKAKSPSAFDKDGGLACAAWQGLQPNGYKVSVFSVMTLRGPARELYEKLSARQWPAELDKDMSALVAAGVW